MIMSETKRREIEASAEKTGLSFSEYLRQKAEHTCEEESQEVGSTTSNGEFMISGGKLWRRRQSQFGRKEVQYDEVKDVDQSLDVSDLRREKLEEEIKLLRARRFDIGARIKKQVGYKEPLSVDQCPKCRVAFQELSCYLRESHFTVCHGTHPWNEAGKNMFIGSGKNELDDLDK